MAEKKGALGIRASRGERRRPGIEAPVAKRIPPRSGLSREEVVASQRRRLLDGMTLAVFHHGYEDTRITDIVELARVSRPTFYEIFEGKDSCFAAAYADGVERLEAAVAAAVGAARERGQALAARPGDSLALAAALDFLAADPALAHLLLVESMAAARPLRVEHERSLDRLADFLRQAPPPAGGEPLRPEMARLLAGGLASHLAGRVLAGEAERLPESRQLLLGYLRTPLPAAPPAVAVNRAAVG